MKRAGLNKSKMKTTLDSIVNKLGGRFATVATKDNTYCAQYVTAGPKTLRFEDVNTGNYKVVPKNKVRGVRSGKLAYRA